MDRFRAAALVTVLVLGASLMGCQGGAGKQMPLRPNEGERRLSDVDVPAGFKQEVDKSWLYADEQLRLAHLRYKGSPGADPAMEFFLTQMQARGWTLDHQDEKFGLVSLVFVKGPELCTITIYRDWGTTHITIDLRKKAH